MKRSFKGILSVCVAVAAFFAVSVSADIQTTDQTKAREGNVLVEVPGTFYNKGNEKILYRLNLIRYTACREGEPEVNADNTGSTGRKLSLAADWGASPTADQLKNKNGDYGPLQWSAELEKIAEIRSAESLLSLSLTRPNSYYEGAISMTVNGYGFFSGETVVWNMDKGFNEAIDTILLERTAWASQNSALTTGHYTYLIGMNRTYAGMSCFRCEKDADGKAVSYKYGGTNCKWGATALVLSETPKAGSKFPLNRDRLYFSTNLSSYKMTTTPRALTGDHTQLVEVATDHVKGFKINGSDRIPNDGKTALAAVVKLNIPGECVPVDAIGSWKVHSGVEWSSSDTSVATVDENGVVTGIAKGNATITAKAGSLKATHKVSVKELLRVEIPDEIKVTAGCDVSEVKLPETVKATWSDGKVTDEAVTWDTADLTQDLLNTRAGTSVFLKGDVSGLFTAQKITVDPATAKEIEFEKIISTKSGTAPELPEKARVTWSNGEVTDSVINWEKLTKDDYTSKIGKTISLKGNCDGTEVIITIKVIRPSLTKIEWISEPAKKIYQEGEILNVEGGKISLDYDDGSSYEVVLTPDMVEGFSDKPGSYTLKVSYEKQSITYDVRVDAKATNTPVPVTYKPAEPEVKADEALISGNSYKLSGSSAVFEKAGGKATVSIPAGIKANGKVYKVTSIADNAFKNDLTIKKLVIGENVTVIGKNAFNGCKNLKSITVKTKKLKASKVGKNAFKGINKKAVFKLPKKKFKVYKAIFKKSAKSSKIKYKKI